jgi:hypothetical protein
MGYLQTLHENLLRKHNLLEERNIFSKHNEITNTKLHYKISPLFIKFVAAHFYQTTGALGTLFTIITYVFILLSTGTIIVRPHSTHQALDPKFVISVFGETFIETLFKALSKYGQILKVAHIAHTEAAHITHTATWTFLRSCN